MQTEVPWAGRVWGFLEGVTTTEGRLAVTAVLVVVSLLVGRTLLPRLVHQLDRSMSDRLATGRVAGAAEVIGAYVPTTLSGALLRVVQLSLIVGTVVAVLVLWGLADLVVMAAAWIADQIPIIGQFLTSFVILFLSYVGAAVLSDMVSDFSTRTEWMTEHQEEILLRVSQLGLFGVMGLLLMTVWRVNLGGLLVGAGFLGIVVGFAARQTLGSLIAGFVLMFSRPFTIGDWVQIGDQEGIVTDITIFNTRLENFDGEFVIIPNDRVSDRAVTNRSQKGLLRLRVDVGIDYEADPDRARQLALDAIDDLTEVVDAPPPQVFPKAFGDSAVVLEMRFWIDHPTPPRKWKAISAVISAVKEAFDEEGVKIPYPQRELTGRAGTGGFEVKSERADRSTEDAPEVND
ncbi:MAG: mechanosensitive ion channel family protein [Haloarculaceae archaeon]